MIKTLIGKKITVSIGGAERQLHDQNLIVGEDIYLNVKESDLSEYSSITGESIEVTINNSSDTIVSIRELAMKSNDPNKEEVINLCDQILLERGPLTKGKKMKQLLSLGSKMASIGSFILNFKKELAS